MRRAEEGWAMPVQFARGVGPERARLLAKLGVATVEDLFYLLPRDYHDLRRATAVRDLREGEMAGVEGHLVHVAVRETPRFLVVEAAFADASGTVLAAWFNQPWAAEKLRLGSAYRVEGKPRRRNGKLAIPSPRLELLDEDLDAAAVPAGTAPPQALPATLLPVYPLTDGLSLGALRRLMLGALEQFAALAPEMLPEEYRVPRGLLPLGDAIRRVHFPADRAEARQARRRLVHDEFLVLQAALAWKRQRRRSLPAAPLPVRPALDQRIRSRLPFPLTDAQDRAVREIVADLARPTPMRRLLQGDVGSGKTAVAAYALLAAAGLGKQGALLAPTEVLARQHARTFRQWLAGSRVQVELLTGSVTAAERARILAGLADGSVGLVVGTHALLQPEVRFANLALAVIDEQHKFGVRQRGRFDQLQPPPHLLAMTATPIPRSLALTWFGDLELTRLHGMPPDRRPTRTYALPPAERAKAYEFLEKHVAAGAQALVVCSRVEEDDAAAVRSVAGVAAELAATGRFPGRPVEILHGRMADDDKAAALARFESGAAAVLVCSVIVEVGIDVPGVDLVLVENAERFGLSQLHQIRGRVGRGAGQGVCLLQAGVDDSPALDRLEELSRTADGFRIAERDARERGIGEIVGPRQHGFAPLRVGDYLQDVRQLLRARRDAEKILAADPDLASAAWSELRSRIVRYHGAALDLADIG